MGSAQGSEAMLVCPKLPLSSDKLFHRLLESDIQDLHHHVARRANTWHTDSPSLLKLNGM